MKIIDCGLIGVHRAVAMQESLAAGIAAGSGEETLLLPEQPSVHTIGSGCDTANTLDPSIAAERTSRGGDGTTEKRLC